MYQQHKRVGTSKNFFIYHYFTLAQQQKNKTKVNASNFWLVLFPSAWSPSRFTKPDTVRCFSHFFAFRSFKKMYKNRFFIQFTKKKKLQPRNIYLE